MANTATAETLSRETIAAALRGAEDERRLQDIEKTPGLAGAESIWVTEADLPRVLDWHTDKCRCVRLRFPAGARLPRGVFFEVNLGDRVPSGPSFRRATREEIAAGIVTREDVARFLEEERPLRSAEALVASVKHEVERAKVEAEAAARRVVDLASALAISESRTEEARAGFEKFFEGRHAEFRTAVADLAQRLATPPPPEVEERPGTVDDLRRPRPNAAEGVPCKIGRDGRPEPLPMGRA